MPDQSTTSAAAPAALAGHGVARLPAVAVDAYNAELRDAGGGFVGDRANQGTFRAILADWRERLRSATGEDPLAEAAAAPGGKIGKKTLGELLAGGAPEAAGVVHAAIEAFAQELAAVVRRFLHLKESFMRDVERWGVFTIGTGFGNARFTNRGPSGTER
jgi:hypothetical protein